MYVRMVSAQLKVNQHQRFSELFHNRVLPMIRNERGFRDAMLLVVSGAPEVVVVTLWDSRETAEASEKKLAPQIQQILSPYLEQAPQMRTYTLAYSTMHNIPSEQVTAFENQSPITTPVPGVGG